MKKALLFQSMKSSSSLFISGGSRGLEEKDVPSASHLSQIFDNHQEVMVCRREMNTVQL